MLDTSTAILIAADCLPGGPEYEPIAAWIASRLRAAAERERRERIAATCWRG